MEIHDVLCEVRTEFLYIRHKYFSVQSLKSMASSGGRNIRYNPVGLHIGTDPGLMARDSQ